MKTIKKRAVSFITAVFLALSLCLYLPETGLKASAEARNMGYVWPVVGSDSISQYWSNSHYGIDITSWDGAERDIIATKAGTIWRKLTGCNNYRGLATGDCTSKGTCSPNYGKYDGHFCNYGMGNGYIIHHDDGTWSEYGHMNGSSLPSDLREGSHVSQGQYLGKMGAAGMADGPHLHFNLCSEAWVNNYFDIYHSKSFNPFNVVNGNDVYNPNPPHYHSYTSTVTKQPTCTEKGTKKYTCSCGDSYTEEIAALGHNYVSRKVPVTMDADGYTEKECSRCHNKIIEGQVAKPVLNKDGWYYCSEVPFDVNSDTYTIQYQNYYEKIQENSPGSDWTNAGVASSIWVNDGSQQETLKEVAASDSRVIVRIKYFHFCGPTVNDWADYYQYGGYVHYDEVPDPNNVWECAKFQDSANPEIYYYDLKWNGTDSYVACKSGETCDGSYGTHDYRSHHWYKMTYYQDRKKVTTYKFTKTSDWTNIADSSAKSVKVRFKPKHVHNAVAYPALEPSCTDNGNTAYWYCKGCKKYFSDEACTKQITKASTVVKATGHAYTEKIIPPTCTKKGYTLHTCTVCGDSYKDNETKLAAHKFGAWKTTVEPTTTTEGTAVRECSKCHKQETKTLEKLPPQSSAPQIVIDTVKAGAGSTVTVNVSLKNNPGIIAFKGSLDYDSDVMTLVKIESKDFNSAFFGPIKNNPIVIGWGDSISGDNKSDGIIAQLTFKIKDKAKSGTYAVKLTYAEDDIYNSEWKNVTFAVQEGSVSVIDYLPGDTNGDGKVNMRDYSLLQQHLSGWKVTINERAADVNGDGKISMKDYSLLQQYLAGWNVELR